MGEPTTPRPVKLPIADSRRGGKELGQAASSAPDPGHPKDSWIVEKEGFAEPGRWLSGVPALSLIPSAPHYSRWLEKAGAVVEAVDYPDAALSALDSGRAYRVLMVDAFVAGQCGVALAERIMVQQPWCRVFVVARWLTAPLMQRTRQLANASVLTPRLSEADFVLQVVTSSRGTASVLQLLARQISRRSKLSPRQERLLWLNLWGYADQEIACALGIQLHTVQDYQLTLRRKTGVKSKAGYLRLLLEYLGSTAPLEKPEPGVESGRFEAERRESG